MNKNASEFRTRYAVFKEEFVIVMQTQGISNHEYFKLIVLEPTTGTTTAATATSLVPVISCNLYNFNVPNK